jgi:hypothetical protein
MGLNNDMKDFFEAEEIRIVLDNKIAFKHKLDLKEDDYNYLNNTKNLHEFAETLVAGAAGAGIVYGGFMAGLGVLGQIGLGIGLISNPIGWMTLAAIGTGGVAYGARQVSKKADEKFHDKLPKYLKTPLDTLGENLIYLFLPICIKVALIDDKFTEEEENSIVDYLSIQWGYNRNYVKNKIKESYETIYDFKSSDIHDTIKYISNETNGLGIETINNEITSVVQELINAGSSHKIEKGKHLKELGLLYT